jgi:hypothetical protein
MPFPKGFDVNLFLGELDKKPELVGCPVVYFDDAVMTTLRVGPLMSSEDLICGIDANWSGTDRTLSERSARL